MLNAMTGEELLEAVELHQSTMFGELWAPCPKTLDLQALLESRRVNNLIFLAAVNGFQPSLKKKKDIVALLCSHLPDFTKTALPWIPYDMVFL
jgi:hypothetical protein